MLRVAEGVKFVHGRSCALGGNLPPREVAGGPNVLCLPLLREGKQRQPRMAGVNYSQLKHREIAARVLFTHGPRERAGLLTCAVAANHAKPDMIPI